MAKPAPTWGPEVTGKKVVKDTEPKTLHTVQLSGVEPGEVSWLWYPYIPAAKMTGLEGDPGLGKSWITCALATAVANGYALPGQHTAMPPQKVLIASAEDELDDVIVPRLNTMDADLDNIFAIDQSFTLDPEGIKKLEETMKSFAAAIVFIDPLVAYLGGKVDMNRANEMRDITKELSKAAERTGAALVTVRHLRKGGGGKSIYKGLGSIDITAAYRSVLHVEEAKSGQKYLRHVKSNYAPKGRALAYALSMPERIPGTDRYTMGEFKWGDFYDDREAFSSRSNAMEQAQTFLFDLLKEGQMTAVEVYQAAAEQNINPTTLNRAKPGVAYSYKEGRTWYWALEGGEGTQAEEKKDA